MIAKRIHASKWIDDKIPFRYVILSIKKGPNTEYSVHEEYKISESKTAFCDGFYTDSIINAIHNLNVKAEKFNTCTDLEFKPDTEYFKI